MARQPHTLYRYRAFDTSTLESLCSDTLYFARPATFNDPLDCNPSLDNDSGLDQLRTLLTLLIKRRVCKEVLVALKKAKFRGDYAGRHAARQGQHAAEKELSRIDYQATDPDSGTPGEEVQACLLTREIEKELLRDYEDGVCCFSANFVSPLLWSHYGDQHRGLCIGYDLDRLPKPSVNRVIYGGSRLINTSTIIRALVDKESKAKAELDRDVLLRKAKGWSFELEWRLVGEHGLQNSPLRMAEVTFGLRCPIGVVFAVTKALSGRDVPIEFYEMNEDRDQYDLGRKALDLSELRVSFQKTARSCEEMFPPTDDAL